MSSFVKYNLPEAVFHDSKCCSQPAVDLMAGRAVRVLMIEDSILDSELVIREIHKSDLEIVAERIDSLASLNQALASFNPAIVLSDYCIPGFGGMQARQVLRQQRPDIPFIFVSGTIGRERVIEAQRQGATDYALKDNRSRLMSAVTRALRESAERRAHRDAELAREEAEQRFRLFMDHLPAAVFIQDTQGQPVHLNSEFERLATAAGNSRLRCGDAMNSFIDRLLANNDAMFNTDQSRGNIDEIEVAGSRRFFLIQKFPIPTADHSLTPLIGGFALDVTNTYYDSLTGLANRQLVFYCLSHSLNDEQTHPVKLAIILIDIHRFRDINDILGRHAGDNVLRLCASELRTAFGTASKTFAHLEGDRFAATVALQDCEINASIQQSIGQLRFSALTNDGNELHIGLRLGIAISPDDGNAADLLFRNAEAALQRASRIWQHYVFYSPEINARMTESVRFEKGLC